MSKKYYEENRDKILQKQKEYYLKNKEIISKNEKEYRKKPEVLKKRQEYLKQYRELNKNNIKIKYNENKDFYKKYDNNRKLERRKLIGNIQLYYGCMNLNCQWEGKFESCQLDFHHFDPLQKTERVSVMMNYSLKKIAQEINKCVVLCRNCHQLFHYGEVSINLNENMLCKVNDNLEIIKDYGI